MRRQRRRSYVKNLLGGDESAQNRLIEGNLHRVLALARNRAGQGVLIGDLVQEGNMALVTAIEEYRNAGVRLLGEPMAEFLERKIDAAMEALVREQSGFARTAERMAADANRLLGTDERAGGRAGTGGHAGRAGRADAASRGVCGGKWSAFPIMR